MSHSLFDKHVPKPTRTVHYSSSGNTSSCPRRCPFFSHLRLSRQHLRHAPNKGIGIFIAFFNGASLADSPLPSKGWSRLLACSSQFVWQEYLLLCLCVWKAWDWNRPLKRRHWNTYSSPLSERAALEYVFITFVRKGGIGIHIHNFVRKCGIRIHIHPLCQKGWHWNTDPSPLSEREPLECYY